MRIDADNQIPTPMSPSLITTLVRPRNKGPYDQAHFADVGSAGWENSRLDAGGAVERESPVQRPGVNVGPADSGRTELRRALSITRGAPKLPSGYR